jgi:hypothetical protein
MTKAKIDEDVRGLYNTVSKIDHVAAVTSAVAKFKAIHCSDFGAVQDGLRDVFFKSAYGKAMYYDYHLPKYTKTMADQGDKYAAYITAALKKGLLPSAAKAADFATAYALVVKGVIDPITKKVTTPPYTNVQKAAAETAYASLPDAEKKVALNAYSNIVHAEITNSLEYKHATSLAMKYVSEIKEAFLLTESAIPGKLNFDLIQNAGRNLTLYDIARLNETELLKVEAGYDWKTLLNDQNKSVVALQVKNADATTKAPTNLGAFVGGLANTVDFGPAADSQKNIDAFVAWVSSDITLEYIREQVLAKAVKGTALSETDQKYIAGLVSLKLILEVPGVEALWPPLETLVSLTKTAIDNDKDDVDLKKNIDDALKAKYPMVDNLAFNSLTGKFELVPLKQVIKNNMFREGTEELAGIAFTDTKAIDAAVETAFPAANKKNPFLTKEGLKKAIQNKTFAIKTLETYASDDTRSLVVGGEVMDDSGALIGLARDPQFPNGVGFTDKNDTTPASRSTLFAVPECYASRVSVDKSEGFRKDLAVLAGMIGSGEMLGANLSSLWDAAKYAGSVVNTENGFFTPLGGGAVLDPVQSKKVIAAYHHEGQVPVVMMTRYVLAQSVAAVVLKLKADFVKANATEEANFDEFLHYVQDLGFAAAIKKLTTGVINLKDTYQDTQEKVDALAKIKFKAVAKLIEDNKASIIADAKKVFETNYVGEKGLMTLLAKDLSDSDEALDLEASADLIFWQTNDSLACLAQNYFGDADASLFGRDFAKSMLKQASKIGVDTYVKAHPDVITTAQLEADFLVDLRTDEVNEINDKVLGLTGEDALAAYYETLVY